MKRGDLVKLVLPGNYVGWHGKVVVSWVHPDELRAGCAEPPAPIRFPEGTLAVFLSDDSGFQLGALDSRILIEGRVGWVWSGYLEAV